MKTQFSLKEISSLSSCLLVVTLFVLSCQKSPDKQTPGVLTDDNKAEAAETIPAAICSGELLKQLELLNASQQKSAEIYEKLTLEKSADLEKTYRASADQQVKLCQGLVDQMTRESIESCLKSNDEKTEENAVYLNLFIDKCSTLKTWQDSLQTDSKNEVQNSANTSANVEVTSAMDFSYLSKGEIKHGLELFKQEALTGTQVCAVSGSAEKVSENTVFKFVSETAATTADIGFEFNGDSSLMVLQDAKNAKISVVCLNAAANSEKNRADLIQKLFHGFLAECDETKPQATEVESTTRPIKKNQTFQETIENAKDAAHAVINEVKKASSAVVARTIQQSQKATSTVIKSTIIRTDHAATKIVQQVKKSNLEKLKAPLEWIQEKARLLWKQISQFFRKTIQSK